MSIYYYTRMLAIRNSSAVTSGCDDIGQVIEDNVGKSTSSEVLDYCIDLARRAIMKENISP